MTSFCSLKNRKIWSLKFPSVFWREILNFKQGYYWVTWVQFRLCAKMPWRWDVRLGTQGINIQHVSWVILFRLDEIGKKKKCAKSCPTLGIPWTVACQAPLSMGFSRQEYWIGLPFPSPGELPDPGIKPRSPALQADALPTGLCRKADWFSGLVLASRE